jgi:hypothetical protein
MNLSGITYLPQIMLVQVLPVLFLDDEFCEWQDRLARLFQEAHHLLTSIHPVEARENVPAFLVVQLLTVPVDHCHTRITTRLRDLPQGTRDGWVRLDHTVPPLDGDLERPGELVRRPFFCRRGRVDTPGFSCDGDLHENVEAVAVN